MLSKHVLTKTQMKAVILGLLTRYPAGKMDDNLIIGFNLLYEFILFYHNDL